MLGPAVVKLNSSIVGHTTDDGFEVTYTPEFADVLIDYYGETVLDKVLTKEELTASLVFAQFESAVLQEVIELHTDNTNPPVSIGQSAGQKLSDEARSLLIRPIANDTTVPTETDDFTIYNAVCTSPVTVPYKFKEQAKLPVTFMALIDTTKTVGNVLGGFGDQTA